MLKMRLNHMLHHTFNYLIDGEDVINWYVNIYYVVGGMYYCYFYIFISNGIFIEIEKQMITKK